MAYLFRGRGLQKRRETTGVLPETTWVNEPGPSGVPPEDTVVVTISRQFGSGGAEIGRIVARNTALRYLDHQIIDEVAQRLGVNAQQVARQDEQTAGTVGHILDAMHSSNPFAINYSSLFNGVLPPSQSTELAYLRLTQKVLLEVATEGNVLIIGRGAQFLLHNSPRTLHIYIFAPLAYRIQNVMKYFQLDSNQALRLIEQRDFEHDTYLRRYYGSDGHQPGLYHLLINTGLFTFELAASLIQQALPVAKEIDH